MRPIDGIVLSNGQIEMRGGVLLDVEHTFTTGNHVKVSWDFTKQRPETIRLANRLYPGASEPDEQEIELYDDCGVEPDEIDAICR